MARHLLASIPCQGATQLLGQFAYAPGKGGDHRLRLVVGILNQHHERLLHTFATGRAAAESAASGTGLTHLHGRPGTQAETAHQILESGIGPQRIEFRTHDDRRIESIAVGLIEPTDCPVGVAKAYIDEGNVGF